MRKSMKIGDKFKVETCKGVFEAEFIDFEVPTIKLETGEVYTGKFRYTKGCTQGGYVYRLEVEGQNTPITIIGYFKCWRLKYEDGIWGESMFCIDSIDEERWYLSKRLAVQDYNALVRFFGSLNDRKTFFYDPKPTGFDWRKETEKSKREVSVDFEEF